MALTGIYVMSGVITLITAVVLIIFIRFIYKEKDKPKNEDIILNALSDYTDGYGLLIKKAIDSNDEIHMIKGSPRDIDIIEVEDKNIKIEDKDLFVRKDLYLPLGTSGHRKMYLALTDKPEDLSKQMDEDLRNALSEVIKKKNSEQDTIKIQNIREQNLLKIAKKTEGFELFDEAVNTYGEMARDSIKQRLPEMPQKKDG